MTNAMADFTGTAILLLDLQNDFLHPDGAYGRAGQTAAALSDIPSRLEPMVAAARSARLPILSSHFTLVPGPGGEPLIAPHLKQLRPFLTRGDFAPGAWGHGLVDILSPSDYSVEKIAYSAFYMTRLEWILRKLEISKVIVAGIVTNGGVASTVRDAHARDIEVILAEDGCGAFSPALHRTAIESLRPVAFVENIDTIADALETFRSKNVQA